MRFLRVCTPAIWTLRWNAARRFAHVVALGIRTDYARSAGQDGAVPGSHEVKREAVERRARLPRQAQQMEQIAHDLEAVAAQLRAVEAGQQVNGGFGG